MQGARSGRRGPARRGRGAGALSDLQAPWPALVGRLGCRMGRTNRGGVAGGEGEGEEVHSRRRGAGVARRRAGLERHSKSEGGDGRGGRRQKERSSQSWVKFFQNAYGLGLSN